jgi:alpha-tubulin suppressor-like RCC1 family protein
VFAWGATPFGYTRNPQSVTINNLNANERIVDAAVGRDHALFLTNQGRVFAFGRNDAGQLGYAAGSISTPSYTVSSQPTGFTGLTAIAIAAGEKTSLVAFDTGALYVFGSVNTSTLAVPTLVDRSNVDPSVRWVSVAVRDTVFYAVSSSSLLHIIFSPFRLGILFLPVNHSHDIHVTNRKRNCVFVGL